MIRNPFPGPLPYRAEDRARFHGRDELSIALRDMILAHRCVTVYGPSGAGKSSLLRASVIPALIDAHEVRVARVDGWPAGEDPTRWLASAMYRDLDLGDLPDDIPAGEAILLAARRAARRAARLTLVVLDQVEQLLYLGRGAEQIEAFFQRVTELVESPLRDVRVVLSLREDSLGRFLARLRDRRWILDHGVRVGPLTIGQLTAVACQVAAAGEPPQTWAPQQIRRLMVQARAPGQPDHDDAEAQSTSAQIVCRALFQRRAQGTFGGEGSISGIFRLDSRALAMLGVGREPTQLAPELRRLLERRFTLVLGDVGEDRSAFLQRLTRFMRDNGEEPEAGASIRALIRQCLDGFGEDVVHALFRQALAAPNATPPPIVGALGRLAMPGVHVSVLWEPHLARAIADRQPERTVYAIQPSLLGGSEPPHIERRAAGGARWEVVPEVPAHIDLDSEIVVLRLHGGYSSEARPAFAQPTHGESDAGVDLLSAEGLQTPAWMRELLARGRRAPALFLGMTILDWRHRMLLRWLFDQRPAPPDSLVMLTPSADPSEAEIWENGGGLPGAGRIAPIVEDPALLVPLLEAFPGGTP